MQLYVFAQQGYKVLLVPTLERPVEKKTAQCQQFLDVRSMSGSTLITFVCPDERTLLVKLAIIRFVLCQTPRLAVD